MTWLSDEDRKQNEEIKMITQQAKAFANGSLVKISIMTQARYPEIPKLIKLDLPKKMTFSEAKEYALSIGHTKVDGYYDEKGMRYEHD